MFVTVPHLHEEVREDVRDMPVLLRGRFVERETPLVHKLSDLVPGDFAFVHLRIRNQMHQNS